MATPVSRIDYDLLLLRLLYKLPTQMGEAGAICDRFLKEYGDLIPKEHFELRESGQEIWRNSVRWARDHLKKQTLLEAPEHGVWKLTDAGRRWVEENPRAEHIRRVTRQASGRPSRRPEPAPAPGLSLEVLEQIRKAMPEAEFRRLLGAQHDQQLAQERAKAITELGLGELGRRAKQWLDEVHAVLRGQNASAPSSEAVCDWIHFCYTLRLYREAAALLQYVRAD